MPGFHHSVAVLPLPLRRSAVVKLRCSVKIIPKKIPFRYSRNSKKIRNGNGNGVRKRERRNGNGMMETGR